MKYIKCILLALVFLPVHLMAQLQNHSFQYDGETRSYIVFLPQDYNGSVAFPVVLNLHGYNHNAEGQMEFSGMNSVADTAGFIAVYPDAIEGRWNSGIGENPSWPTPNVDDVGFIDVLIDTLFQQYNIDMERVYACGVSNGGFMSLKLACQLDDRLAAIASVAGVLSTSNAGFCTADYPMPVLYFHGTADNIIPFNGGQTGWYSAEGTLEFWTGINECTEADTVQMPNLDPLDGCTVEKITYLCNDAGGVTFFKILNGGHTWPSSTFTFDPGIVGNTTYDINASVEIWNFFKNFYLTTTSIESTADAALAGDLLVYPNPVVDGTTIDFQLNEPGFVTLSITDISGRLVEQRVCTDLQQGHHKIMWPARGIENGAYFLVLRSNGMVITKTILVAKP